MRTASCVALMRGRPRDFLVLDIDIGGNISYQKIVGLTRRVTAKPALTTSELEFRKMATSQHTTFRFHNLSDAALADELGRVDAISKAAETELKALKDEFKARGLNAASGEAYAVTATEQIAGRLDSAAVKAFLGAAVARFEIAVVSTVIRVRPAARRLAIAA
jgi:hypothetical protein